MFEKHNINEGELLTNGEKEFICTFNNGNPGDLKWYFRVDGFWNYIETDKGEWIYKNCINKVGEEIEVINMNKYFN